MKKRKRRWYGALGEKWYGRIQHAVRTRVNGNGRHSDNGEGVRAVRLKETQTQRIEALRRYSRRFIWVRTQQNKTKQSNKCPKLEKLQAYNEMVDIERREEGTSQNEG